LTGCRLFFRVLTPKLRNKHPKNREFAIFVVYCKAMKNEKPLILVTNDDGITAPWIAHLVKLMKEIGEVVVVAPDSPQSGMGHAITVENHLYCDPVKLPRNMSHKAFSCSGTPVDCVKI